MKKASKRKDAAERDCLARAIAGLVRQAIAEVGFLYPEAAGVLAQKRAAIVHEVQLKTVSDMYMREFRRILKG